MSMVKVESSTIKEVSYENCVLIVKFMNGSVYSYSDVPPKVFEDFLNSHSKGKFLHENIKGQYKHCKLTD